MLSIASFQLSAGKIKAVLGLWLLCQSFLLCSAWAEGGLSHSLMSHTPTSQMYAAQLMGTVPENVVIEKAANEASHLLSYASLAGQVDHSADHAYGQSGKDSGMDSASACCDGKHDYIPSVSLSMIAVALLSFLLLGIIFRLRSRHRFHYFSFSSLLFSYPRSHIVHCTFLD